MACQSDGSKRELSTRLFQWAILAILLVSAILINVENILLMRMFSQRTELARARPGEAVGPLSVKRVDAEGNEGENELLDFSSSPVRQVLFLLSPTCSYCSDNVPYWTSISKGLDRERFRVIVLATKGLEMDSTREQLQEYARLLQADVRVASDQGILRRYRLTTTPQTLILGTDGRVEKVWLGRLSSWLTWREVTGVLGIDTAY